MPSSDPPPGPPLHPLLLRQLRRLGWDPATPVDPRWADLLRRVSLAYLEHEQDRQLLERSQDLASAEMTGLYATLREERDALERRVHERTEALRVSEGRLASLLSLSADWIWEQDAELRYSFVSDGFSKVLGMAPRLIGRQHVFGDTLDAEAEARSAYEAAVAERRPYRDFTYAIVRPDGMRRWVRVSGEPVFDESGSFRGYRGVGRDVTEVVAAQRQVEDLARHDHLTGLPNRRLFLAELERAIARNQRAGTRFALCFIDLDRFKDINDTMGHLAGDEVLVTVSQRLRDALRASDIVARLGGDEFVVMLEQAADPADLSRIADMLMGALGRTLAVGGRDLQVTASLGMARYPDDGADVTTLLRHADAAMYQAKQAGGRGMQFYTAALADEAARRFELESELRLALARDELLLYYQPKVSVGGRTLVGVEALVRWKHPQRGLVPPGDFIPLAEDRGLIVPLGRWVIDAACRQLAAWRRQGLQAPTVAVNVSAQQFAGDTLVQDLRSAMARHGVAGGDLEIELTETVLMSDPARAKDVLESVRSLGVRISIDDFGTGYSSLSYLKRFPADEVKIDRSFIGGLPGESDDVVITQAVIAMAHSLGLHVVAEGVETEAQLDMLGRLGCDKVQGYLLGRPMPAEALAGRLAAGDAEREELAEDRRAPPSRLASPGGLRP